MNKIREIVKGEKIWVSIDETVDSTGRYVANDVIGLLSDEPKKTYYIEN